MLLINGMPVIHVELKKSGIPVSQACHQIEKYAHEGIFTGLFSLVQIFVAMTPDETLYYANPGPDNKFNPDYYFHWADYNNEPVNDWVDIASQLLSIPMAHMLIGFYTSRVVLKALGAEDFGTYNVVGGVVVMFTFINAAMTTGTQRHLSFELGKPDGNVSRIFWRRGQSRVPDRPH